MSNLESLKAKLLAAIRRKQVAQRALDNSAEFKALTEAQNDLNKIQEELKLEEERLLADYATRQLIQQLQREGFEVREEGKSFKIIRRANPGQVVGSGFSAADAWESAINAIYGEEREK